MALRVASLTTRPITSCPGFAFQLTNVNFEVPQAGKIALVGPNGSGKSTLLRALLGTIDLLEGSVAFDDDPFNAEVESSAIRFDFAYVGQDPDASFVTSTVEDEVAFALCNTAMQPDDIRARVTQALAVCGIEHLRYRSLSTLSGGQKQRVCIAAALALKPRVLLLDEPFSMLDAKACACVRQALASFDSQTSLIQISHRFDEISDFDSVIALEAGRIVWQGSPREFLVQPGLSENIGLQMTPCATCEALPYEARFTRAGWTSMGGANSTRGEAVAASLLRAQQCSYVPKVKESGPIMSGASFDAASSFALRDIDLEIEPAQLTLLVGDSGSGKTTLACILAGLLAPCSGHATLDGHCVTPGSVGLAFQRVEDQLFRARVIDDVAFGPQNCGLRRRDALRVAAHALANVGLDTESIGILNPQCLSGGQKRRVALAGVFAMESQFVILDEPTVGLDAAGIHSLLAMLASLLKQGRGVLVVTHEPEVFFGLAEKAYMLENGRIQAMYADERGNVDA